MCSPNAGPRERELYRKWKENNPDTPFPISPVQKDPTTSKPKSTTRKRKGLFAPMTDPNFNLGVIKPSASIMQSKESLATRTTGSYKKNLLGE
jgi:hypothetical protein